MPEPSLGVKGKELYEVLKVKKTFVDKPALTAIKVHLKNLMTPPPKKSYDPIQNKTHVK